LKSELRTARQKDEITLKITVKTRQAALVNIINPPQYSVNKTPSDNQSINSVLIFYDLSIENLIFQKNILPDKSLWLGRIAPLCFLVSGLMSRPAHKKNRQFSLPVSYLTSFAV